MIFIGEATSDRSNVSEILMKKALRNCLLFLCSLSIYLPTAQACSCIPAAYDFCTTQQDLPGDVILLGKKLDDFQYGMHVEVLEVLAGNENRDTVLIWGDPGWLCRPYASGFAIGDSFVFSIVKHVSVTQPPENVDDYWISICGVYWLRYSNGWVYGNNWQDVTPGVNARSLEDFRNQGCFLTGREEEIEPPVGLSVFPNPVAEGECTVMIPGQQAPLSVTDLMGRTVFSLANAVSGGFQPVDVTISTSGWRSGIYFVRYREEVIKVLVE